MEDIFYTPFEEKHIEVVKVFTDRWIGTNYYSVNEIEEILEKSHHQGLNASLLAWAGERLVGVRLTLAPTRWIKPEIQITPSLWNIDPQRVGYFKSLFVDEKFRTQGVGKTLSAESQKILQKQGAEAIVTHSWLQSPQNSSQKYLLKSGFVEVARHEKFWEHIDYDCPHCFPNRCGCTAVEMIKYLK